ncbi:MAG: deoxynucleoside kinase [Nanoarchaeota archaeon]|nr:deoxynucleoside kinase [Nanoarchaeota archaeon]
MNSGKRINVLPIDAAYIAITGNIACGKSNLARHISNFWKFNFYKEPLDHDVLSRYYADMATYGFDTQEHFILSRAERLKKIDVIGGYSVTDFAFGVDSQVYALFLKQKKLLTRKQHTRLVELEEGIGRVLPSPDLLIYLRTGVETLKDRIRTRDRDVEQDLLTPERKDYLPGLEKNHERMFKNHEGKKAIIQTDELALVPDFNRGSPRPTNLEETLSFINECLHREYSGTPFMFVKSYG